MTNIPGALQLLAEFLAELPQLQELSYEDQQPLQLWIDKIADVLTAAFGGDSDEYERFSNARPHSASFRGSPEVHQREYLNKIALRETALQSILQKHAVLSKLRGQASTVTEAVYPPGSQYDAYKVIRDLVEKATQSLLVADPYVDSTLLELLEMAGDSVEVKVLTRDMQGDFKLAASKFNQQRANLAVRKEPGELHDRFLIVDGHVYHLGASIKDAGNKVFGINKLEQPQVTQTVIQIIQDLWDKSEVVV